MRRIEEILGVTLLVFCILGGCQTSRIVGSHSMSKRIRMACPPTVYAPIYLVTLSTKQITIDPLSLDSVLLNQIDPNWISEITIDRSTETLKKYEEITNDGLVIIRLKNKSTRKMSQDLKIAFQKPQKAN